MINLASFPVRVRSELELDQIATAYRIAQGMADRTSPSQLQFMADVLGYAAEANDDDLARATAQAYRDKLQTIIG